MPPDADNHGDECVRRVGDAVALTLAGDITEIQADRLGQTFHCLFDDGVYKIVLDMTRARFISSTGLGRIMMAYKECSSNGGYLRLVNPQPLIVDILQVTKLDSVLEVFNSVEEAVAHKSS
ncbi:MAG TPA: STAS domain-containing protein [Candidatus Brocadiia bacterium]|nr:STAS domain-containing protein [Candidatus Brocadiia bacterium]